ncbi:MAG: TIGR04211 family SH3 domain-containing protein [Thioalkalispiraceae bacterium]|jgi:SH3 domain protein
MPRNIFLLLLLGFACAIASGNLYAQEVYVKDSLRVGVRTEPGNAATPIAVVTTGMKLEIVESSGDYVKIKAPSGIEGWIKRTYVSEEIPAVIQLEGVQIKLKELETKLAKQTKHAQATALNNKNLSAEIEQLKQANAELRVQLEDELQSNMASGLGYFWKLVLLILFAVAGFALGVVWYRKKTMKRLGGLHF